MSDPSGVLEIPTCSCGQSMHATTVAGFFFCLNCDRGQVGVATLQTKVYNRVMVQREERESWYPNVPPRRGGGL